MNGKSPTSTVHMCFVLQLSAEGFSDPPDCSSWLDINRRASNGIVVLEVYVAYPNPNNPKIRNSKSLHAVANRFVCLMLSFDIFFVVSNRMLSSPDSCCVALTRMMPGISKFVDLSDRLTLNGQRQCQAGNHKVSSCMMNGHSFAKVIARRLSSIK